MRRWLVAVATILLLTVPIADVLARGSSSSGGSSRSSGGSSSGGSKSGSSGGSKSSGSKAGAGGRSQSGINKAKPTSAKPSSGPKRQPSSSHLIPRQFQKPGDLPGRSRTAYNKVAPRNIGSDGTFLRSSAGRRHLDPYSPHYYGYNSSIYHYLFLAALLDDDDDDPIRGQRCREYDDEEEVCLDYIEKADGGGDCSGGFVLWPWLLFGGGGLALRRRLAGGRA